jgi:hypothetical protein
MPKLYVGQYINLGYGCEGEILKVEVFSALTFAATPPQMLAKKLYHLG